MRRRKGGAAAQQLADKFAELIRPLLEDDLAGLSANATAQELNRRGVRTARGGSWTATLGPEPESAGVLMSHRPFAVRGAHAGGA